MVWWLEKLEGKDGSWRMETVTKERIKTTTTTTKERKNELSKRKRVKYKYLLRGRMNEWMNEKKKESKRNVSKEHTTHREREREILFVKYWSTYTGSARVRVNSWHRCSAVQSGLVWFWTKANTEVGNGGGGRRSNYCNKYTVTHTHTHTHTHGTYPGDWWWCLFPGRRPHLSRYVDINRGMIDRRKEGKGRDILLFYCCDGDETSFAFNLLLCCVCSLVSQKSQKKKPKDLFTSKQASNAVTVRSLALSLFETTGFFFEFNN